MRTKNDYSDIINYPYRGSKRPNKMAAIDRAAQFSPFAALTGYEAAVEDMAKRNTAEQLELEKPVDMEGWDPGSKAIDSDWDPAAGEPDSDLAPDRTGSRD